jgi:hypothetical protein
MTLTTFCRAALLALLLASSVNVAWGANPPVEARIFVASGVPAGKVLPYLARLDRLAEELEYRLPGAGNEARAQAIHAFLHERILRGRYEPSASDLGVALDGGSFNCVSATVLYTLLADRCGVNATAMSVPGHVWCRVEGVPTIDIESTAPDWFAIRAKYRGIPTGQVSASMAKHRRRQVVGQPLDEPQLLAVLHYNRGVSLIHQGRLSAAAWENLQAVALDPQCRPARENLAAVTAQISGKNSASNLSDALILWALENGARNRF